MLTNQEIAFLCACIDKTPMTGIKANALAVQVYVKLQGMKEDETEEEVVSK